MHPGCEGSHGCLECSRNYVTFPSQKLQTFFWKYFEEYIRLTDPDQNFQLHLLQFRLLFPQSRPSRDKSPHVTSTQDRSVAGSKENHPYPVLAQDLQLAEHLLAHLDPLQELTGCHFTSEKTEGSGEEAESDLPECDTGAKWQGWSVASFWLPMQGWLHNFLFLRGTNTFYKPSLGPQSQGLVQDWKYPKHRVMYIW